MIENTQEDIKASNRVAIKSRVNQADQMKKQLSDFIEALKKDFAIKEVEDAFEDADYILTKNAIDDLQATSG